MNTKMKMRTLSLLLCFVMLVGLVPTTVFAAGTKLETPQNLKLQGTMLSWDAVDNADFYGVTLYHPNYVYSIGSWQTDGTNFNLYKYLKDGKIYGATVIACSNGSYQISAPAEIPLTACTNAGVPIYRDVNVVNGTSSNATAYPGMSVCLEAKPAPAGMVFDRWELSGGYINIGYSDTDTTIYVQAICDNDISARATYKYQENVTSAFTVQPQGGAALVGESFNVTYAMNFTPQGTVKVQVEGNTPGSFTDLKQGTIDSASIKEDSVVTKTFRIMASDGTRNIYSDEFVVSWEDGPRFISQPVGGTVGHNVDYVATYALNFTPFSCRVERYNDYLGQWNELSFASATQATISSYDFNTSSKYRIKAIIQGGGEVYSDEFTVTWSDAVSKFIQHPVSGTVGLDEDFSFTFAINFTPVSNIAIQKYNSGFDSWDTVGYCTSLTSGTISGFASETTNKYRLEAYENGNPIRSNEFTVTWEGTDYTVSFAANGGSGTMADVNNVSGEYTLPACGFTAPNGQRFKAWLVGGNEKAVGDKITVSANTVVTAIWENILEYIVSYNANGGSGTMVGDMVEENGKFTLENCTYNAPEGYQFKAWAIGSVNGEQKQPGEQITITAETYIYAIWEAVEYNVTVTGGTASVGAGTPITKATMGTTVTLTAGAAPTGQMFDKWVVNGVVVDDANSATTTFVMPAGNVTAEATYKNIPVVTYTVSFDANGGTGSMADATGVSGEYTLPACGFTAPNGQRFKAWLVGGNEKAVGDKITVSANTVVTAVWENIPEYIVSYNANGGSGTMTGDMVTENDTFTLEPCTYTAPEGYKFKAWAIGSVNGEQKQPGEQITITAETYIYAIWEAVEYNVTVTGGTASVGAGTPITKATMGTTVTLTAGAAPSGKMFDKWVVTGVVVADANNATTTFVMPAGNVTAEATYKNIPVVTYTVSFDANGGTGSMADATGVSGDYVLPVCGFTAPNGKQFKAWSVGGVEKAAGDTITVNANTTVTAIWENIPVTYYTVTFDSNGGSAVTAQSIEAGQKATKPDDPTKDGFDFKGWTLNGSAYDFNTAVNSNITLVAAWDQQQVQPTVYTVTFDSNGGSAVTAQSIESGQKATKPADPTKDGYDFKGWTLNGSAYDFNTAVNGNITLVATWEQQQVVPTTYTVSFAANGGTGTMADVTGISGEYTLPENGFTAPDGKQFKAWSVDGNEKAVGDKITVTADTTVTAVWETIPAGHTCDIKPVAKVEPSCTEGGKEAYYKCEGCGKFYEDALGTKEITDLASWGNLAKLGHTESDWKSDKDNHWKECTVAGCGVIIENSKAAHADANNDGKCDICEYNVGKTSTNPGNKPSDDVQNPQTGDNSMMWLWVALLFVSGFGVVATTVYGKRRTARK